MPGLSKNGKNADYRNEDSLYLKMFTKLQGNSSIHKNSRKKEGQEQMGKKTIVSTTKFCPVIGGLVNLQAEVLIPKPRSERREVLEWLDCDYKNQCNKKCNLFWGRNLANFLFDEPELHRI